MDLFSSIPRFFLLDTSGGACYEGEPAQAGMVGR
jgi:hypothetical protein